MKDPWIRRRSYGNGKKSEESMEYGAMKYGK